MCDILQAFRIRPMTYSRGLLIQAGQEIRIYYGRNDSGISPRVFVEIGWGEIAK